MALTQQGGGRQLRIPRAPAPPRPRQRLSGERGCLGAGLGAGVSLCLLGPPRVPRQPHGLVSAPWQLLGAQAAVRWCPTCWVCAGAAGHGFSFPLCNGEVPEPPPPCQEHPLLTLQGRLGPSQCPRGPCPSWAHRGCAPLPCKGAGAGEASCLEPRQCFALAMAGSGACRVRNPLPGTWLHPLDLLVGLSSPGGSRLHSGAGGLVGWGPAPCALPRLSTLAPLWLGGEGQDPPGTPPAMQQSMAQAACGRAVPAGGLCPRGTAVVWCGCLCTPLALHPGGSCSPRGGSEKDKPHCPCRHSKFTLPAPKPAPSPAAWCPRARSCSRLPPGCADGPAGSGVRS